MVLGNTGFTVEAIKEMSYAEFETAFKGKLQYYDLKAAYKLLTGRNPAKPVKDESIKRPVKKSRKV